MATVLITGCDRGIGLELARALVERGDDVVATCLGPSLELTALGVRVEHSVDVTDDASVEALDERLGDLGLDVLISNAGIQRKLSLRKLDFDSIREQLEVNALGPLRVIARLRHRLAAGSKVAIVSSRMGSLSANNSGGNYGYRMSKAALNMAGVSLAHDLEADGVAVMLLHPGWVKTKMTRNRGSLSPRESALGLIARIDELTLEQTGCFVHQDGKRLGW